MAFGLYSLLEAALLVLNAMCVLHEERFLAKVIKMFCLTCCSICSATADVDSILRLFTTMKFPKQFHAAVACSICSV